MDAKFSYSTFICLVANGVAFHPSAHNSDTELKNYCQIFLTILFNRTTLLAILTFFTNPKT
jgi:hypothetical protein